MKEARCFTISQEIRSAKADVAEQDKARRGEVRQTKVWTPVKRHQMHNRRRRNTQRYVGSFDDDNYCRDHVTQEQAIDRG